MAIYTRTGKLLLNPIEKFDKYRYELKMDIQRTADGRIKRDNKGNLKHLTRNQRCYRQGYVDAVRTSQRAFAHAHSR